MALIIAIPALLALQAFLIVSYHLGEVSLFWLVVMELLGVPASLAILALCWAASVNWAE